MIKIFLYIIYIISVLPILFYPVVLMAGIMGLSGIGMVEKNWITFLSMMLYIFSIIYPAYIVLLIYLSHKHSSWALALLALLPGILLFYMLNIHGSTKGKQRYETTLKEYVCKDQNVFLSVDGGKQDKVGEYFVVSYAKNKKLVFLDEYVNDNLITSVIDDKILIEDDETRNLLKDCKNEEGDSVLDKYKEVSVEEWRAFKEDQANKKEVESSRESVKNTESTIPQNNIITTNEMETYSNSNFAYGIQYPKNWIIKEYPESETVDFQIPGYPDVWITTWARVQVEDTSPPGEPFQLSNGEKAYYMTNTIKIDSVARFYIFHYKNGNMYYVGVEYPLPYNKEFFNEYMELFHEVMRSLDVKS